MGFKAEQKCVFDLFTRKTYSIPRNQRRYVWQQQNWEELFEDIQYSIDNNKSSHFLGSFVLKDEGRHQGIPDYTIIDGQQRIITLTIFLGSILYWLRKEKMIDDFNGTKAYLFTQDDKGKETSLVKSNYHLSLEVIIDQIKDLDDETFHSMPLNRFLEKGCVNSQTDKSIILAFKYFIEKIEETVKLKNDINYLIDLRDAVENISFINIVSSSEEDSYTIFEILNARGTSLEDYELLKNYIMRYIQPEYNRDNAKKVWGEIEGLVNTNFKKFIKHYAIHKCKYKRRGESDYKAIQREYKKRDTQSLLFDLNKKAEIYRRIIEPQHYCKIDSVEYRVLLFFRKNRQEQLRPVLLSIIHHHMLGDINDKLYDNTLDFLYNFYVCFNIIGESNSNKLTNVINKYAHLIENEYKDDTLEKFILELKSKLPNKDVFKNAFKNVGYSKYRGFYEGANNKEKTQIVLEVLERYLNNGICVPNFTIEHVLDDSSSNEHGQIGNLIPLEENYNLNLNRKSFDQKRQKYLDSNYKTTRNFANRFTEECDFVPSNRTAFLADLFYDKILQLNK